MELFKLFGKIAVDNKEANKSLDDTSDKGEQAESKLSGAFKKIGAAVATYFAADKIISFGKEVVSMAAEVSAETSAFEQIMGNYANEASAKVGKIASATGMVDTRLTPYMTSMTAKFKGLGYDIDEATDFAARGLNIAADASAFWDKSLDDSMGHLNSFINGSYEGGEAIGLFANDTQMASYAVSKGIVAQAKDWASLDEKTKQATRLEYAENMFKMSGATGQAAKESKQYANVQANLTEKWRQFKAQIGEPLLQNVVLPAMQKLSSFVDIASEKFQSLQKWVSENKTKLQVLAGILTGLATGIAVFTVAVNASSIALKAQAIATNLVATAQKLLNLVMNANPIGLIIAVIAALVAAFIYLWNNCEGFRNFWIGLWDKIKEAAKKVADWFKNAWGEVIDWFKGIWNGVKSVIDTVINFIKNNWKSMLLFLVNPLAGVFKFMYDHFEGFRDFVDKVISNIKNFFVGLWDKVKEVWNNICNAISVAIQFIGSLISAAFNIITLPFKFIWENCKEYVSAAWEWIKEKVSNAINNVKDTIVEVWTAVSDFFSKIWDGIKKIFSTAWEKIKSAVSKAINAVKTTISTVFNAVKTFVSTVWNAIKSTISTVWSGIKTVVSTAINAVKTTVSNIFNSVKGTVSTVWNGIKSTISTVWNGIKTSVSSAVNSVKDKVSSVFNSVKTKVSSVWNGIRDAIKKPIEKARDLVKTAIDKIKGFMNFKWSLPKLKLPHFSIKGKFSLDPPSVPKLSIDWYKRAYESAAMFTNPTVLPTLNGYKGFGDGNGAEFVTGQRNLENTVKTAVQQETSGTIEKLETLISMFAKYMPELIANSKKEIRLNNGVLVGELASDMDYKLGEINRLRERGH